jgi:hypothetical protein
MACGCFVLSRFERRLCCLLGSVALLVGSVSLTNLNSMMLISVRSGLGLSVGEGVAA